MIVSITGGSGFIGSHLVQRLINQGDHVRLLTRKKTLLQKNVKYYFGDLTDRDINLTDFLDGTDVVYHCAGEIIDESVMRKLHVDGTRRLVEESQKVGVSRWVQLSSIGAYGVCKSGVVSESSPERPYGVYDLTKTESDKIIKSSDIPYVILRPSTVFGSTMRNQSLFQLVEMVRKGFFFYLGEVGALVNYVHVEDVVEALVKCGNDDRALGNIYMLSQTTEIEKLVSSVASGLGIRREPLRFPEWLIRKLSKIFIKIPGFPLTNSRIEALTGHCRYESEKIRVELDFKFMSPIESKLLQFASGLKL